MTDFFATKKGFDTCAAIVAVSEPSSNSCKNSANQSTSKRSCLTSHLQLVSCYVSKIVSCLLCHERVMYS